ncbi:TetR/AcrR family transcriptional regulator [Natronosporangium hydrolyticum]|uniref:TetR/AcrR family transcriptional regulator n=1 Tax=Natronosporangium hydrolyticum TaxID=2811111 RepID=A0A895YHW9_9ACTN|nr:TetR/AcrR family transcriptional regulator [Natronosporangium hydrolyticum]QSB15119.1 TetR/AcrR family transcriptional regulator [Natronosporangium hydrolyticum]
MPRQVDRAARREQILAAAVQVFAEKGFAATRVDEIAAAAGVAKGSVYLYFDSREAILTAAFAAYAERSREILAAAAADPGAPLTRLETLIRSVLALVSSDPQRTRLLVDFWAAGIQNLPRLEIATVYQDYRATVTDLLQQAAAGGDLRTPATEAYAAVVVGAVEGCLLQWLVDPQLPIDELADPLIDLCQHGLRNAPK